MKTVKFISTDTRQKQFATEVRKRVNQYFKENGISPRGNAVMYFKAIVMLTVYLLPFVIILTMNVQAWVALILAVIMGIGEAGVGMCVMHDAAHETFSNKKWINRLLASTMYLLGSGLFNWRIQHNLLHHTFTNIYGYDQDIDAGVILRLSEHAPLKKYHRYQYIYAFFLYGLMTLAKFVTDFSQLNDFNKSGITREQRSNPNKETFKLYAGKIVYLLIVFGLPLWLSNFKWWEILIGFSVLHITAGIIMSTVFQTAHVVEATKQPLPDDNGIIHDEWMVHQLKTTSDFARNNRILSWYIGGLNFQIEHHLFSNICHIHYNKIAPIVEETAKQFGMPYFSQPSFSSAVASHTRTLKYLGK